MSAPKASVPVAEPDLAIVSGQLGRTARDVTGIAVRCPYGRPAVIESAPTLAGKPNPNLLYLTCPTATVAISTIEAAGGVKRFKDLVRADAELRRSLDAVVDAYKRRRAALAAGRRSAARGRHRRAPRARRRRRACTPTPPRCWPRGPGGSGGEAGAQRRRRPGSRFLPPPETLWCTDDRCARWAAGTDERRSRRRRRPPAAVGAAAGGRHRYRHHLGAAAGGRRPRRPPRAGVPAGGDHPAGGGAAAGRPSEPGGQGTHRGRGGEIRGRGAAAGGRSASCSRAPAPAARRPTAPSSSAAWGRSIRRRAVVLSGRGGGRSRLRGRLASTSPDDPVVLDVGGGSTELIRRDSGGAIESVSLPLGASRGTERWITSDPPLAGGDGRGAARKPLALMEPLRARFGAGRRRDPPGGRRRHRDHPGLSGRRSRRPTTPRSSTCARCRLESVDRLIGLLAGMTTAAARGPALRAGRPGAGDRGGRAHREGRHAGPGLRRR